MRAIMTYYTVHQCILVASDFTRVLLSDHLTSRPMKKDLYAPSFVSVDEKRGSWMSCFPKRLQAGGVSQSPDVIEGNSSQSERMSSLNHPCQRRFQHGGTSTRGSTISLSLSGGSPPRHWVFDVLDSKGG